MKNIFTLFLLLCGFGLQAQITIPNTSICEYDTCVGFADQTPGAIAWSWDFGDPASGPNNFSTQQYPFHCYPHGITSYTVTCTVTTMNGTLTNTAVFQFVAVPVTAFSYVNLGGNNVQFTDLSTGGVVWRQWDYGDTQTGGTTNAIITHQYATAGTYSVTLVVTDSNGCIGSLVQPATVSPTGITETGQRFASVYPNPAASEMTIEFPGATGATTVEFFDATGRLVLAGTFTGGRFRVDVSALPQGTYVLQLRNGEQTARQQVSISR